VTDQTIAPTYRLETTLMGVTPGTIQAIVVLLSSRGTTIGLMMVGLSVTGVTQVVLRRHIARPVGQVIGKAVGASGGLKDHRCTPDQTPDEGEIGVVAEIDLLPHGIVALYTIEGGQLTRHRIYIMVAVVGGHLQVRTTCPCTRCPFGMTGLTGRIGNGRTLYIGIRGEVTGLTGHRIVGWGWRCQYRQEAVIMGVTAGTVGTIVVLLSSRGTTIGLMMVGLSVTGVTQVVLRRHIARPVGQVIGKAVGASGGLKDHRCTPDHAPDEGEIDVVAEVDLLPHGIVALYTIEGGQLTRHRIYIMVAVVGNHLQVRASAGTVRGTRPVAGITLIIINGRTLHGIQQVAIGIYSMTDRTVKGVVGCRRRSELGQKGIGVGMTGGTILSVMMAHIIATLILIGRGTAIVAMMIGLAVTGLTDVLIEGWTIGKGAGAGEGSKDYVAVGYDAA